MQKTEDFDYKLDKKLIAQKPMRPRDKARLLLLNKKKEKIETDIFLNITNYLQPGDLLVINDTKVFKARIKVYKETKGELEIFLLKQISEFSWQCLIKGRVKEGLNLNIDKKNKAKIIKKNKDNTFLVSFNTKAVNLKKLAKTPIPPYIRKGKSISQDNENYQTIYADDKKDFSVAAPTAGLHFSNRVLKKLKEKGVKIAKITLHVGLGTFLPVKTTYIKDHKMHKEQIIIKEKELKKILEAKQDNRRVIAVGTTVCRTLESLALDLKKNKKFKDYKKETDIFIYPGFDFKITSALLTNFHLPKSSLLMLVSAFATRDLISQAYQEAISKKFRFYSYGDAMLIF